MAQKGLAQFTQTVDNRMTFKTLPLQVGILGGSGFYSMPELANAKVETITTPFGNPSDNPVSGTIDGVPCVVLSRYFPRSRIKTHKSSFQIISLKSPIKMYLIFYTILQ